MNRVQGPWSGTDLCGPRHHLCHFHAHCGRTQTCAPSCILFAPGTLLFIFARREQAGRLFTKVEWGLFALILGGAGHRRHRPCHWHDHHRDTEELK